jgi:hypothetical protein
MPEATKRAEGEPVNHTTLMGSHYWRVAAFCPSWVKSVACSNGQPHRDFRYSPLTAKLWRHCNMSRKQIRAS